MQSSTTDVAELIRLAKEYNQEAFTELYRMSVQPVYRYLFARVSSTDVAEDLTQEVYMAAVWGIGALRSGEESGLYAWLFQIARYKLADYMRKRYHKQETTLDEADSWEADTPSPEESAVDAEDRAEVARALGQLTDEQREVMLYKYVLEYDNQKTAQLLGKNINSVNQLHHRALASLHRILTGGKKLIS